MLRTSIRIPQMLRTKQQCEHFGPQKLAESRMMTLGEERGRGQMLEGAKLIPTIIVRNDKICRYGQRRPDNKRMGAGR